MNISINSATLCGLCKTAYFSRSSIPRSTLDTAETNFQYPHLCLLTPLQRSQSQRNFQSTSSICSDLPSMYWDRHTDALLSYRTRSGTGQERLEARTNLPSYQHQVQIVYRQRKLIEHELNTTAEKICQTCLVKLWWTRLPSSKDRIPYNNRDVDSFRV